MKNSISRQRVRKGHSMSKTCTEVHGNPWRVVGPLAQWSREFAVSVSAALLLGCSTLPVTSTPAVANSSTSAAPISESELMYELLVAELAGRRGDINVAAGKYLWASTRTDDPRVADRATKLAIYNRQWDFAEQAARRWLELDPGATEAVELLARVLLRGGDVEGAVNQFSSIITDSEDRGALVRSVYDVLVREPDLVQSLGVMQGLALQFPDEIEVHLGVARLAYAQNQREMSLEAADKALTVNPENEDALLIKSQVLSNMGRPEEGFALLREALEKHPDHVQLRLGYARLLVTAGRYDEISAETEILFKLAPEDPEVLLAIGLLSLDSRRNEAAETYLQQLLQVGGRDEQANFYLARLADERQEFERAIKHYDAVPQGDFFVSSQIRAAELHARIGQLEQGRTRLGELSAMLPTDALQKQLITAEARMLQTAGDAAESVEVLTSGLETYPEDSELLYARALAADGIGDEAMLESDLGTLIAKEPDNAHALNALGYYLVDNNLRLEEAEVYLERAIELLPDDPAIMDSLGWLRYRQGEYAEAIQLLQQAYAAYPDGEIAAHLGEVLWVSGEQEEARSLWEKALVDDPDHAVLNRVVEQYIR